MIFFFKEKCIAFESPNEHRIGPRPMCTFKSSVRLVHDDLPLSPKIVEVHNRIS